MASGGEFYIADVRSLGNDNKVKVEEKVLHFRFPKTGFDDRASRQHIKDFEVDYSNFKQANPDFVNPFGDEPDAKFFVGSKILNPGDTTAEKVTSEDGKEVASEDVKSDDQKAFESTQPHEGVVDVAPESKGSEAPKGEDALEAPVSNPDADSLSKSSKKK